MTNKTERYGDEHKMPRGCLWGLGAMSLILILSLIAAILGLCAWLKPDGDEWEDDHDW